MAPVIGLPDRGLRSANELGADRPHGVRLRYMAGCRCAECRRANTQYETQRERARKAGDWNGVVDAAPARAHILKLSRAGVGRKMVAAASGVAHSAVYAIRSGSKLRIRARTARRILAVDVTCRGDKALICAKQLWQRINWLLEEGYTKTFLAKQLGYAAALQFDKHTVTVRNDADVAALYRRLTT
jgi:hypothetical protein